MPQVPNRGVQVHTITTKFNGLSPVLYTEVSITLPGETNKFKVKAIWDTGASGTVITQKVIENLGLLPTGTMRVSTASETNISTDSFLIDLYLKDDLNITGMKVIRGTISDQFNCLIGMDIISLGDFSVTNYLGQTCMSYRIPSMHEIDYYKAMASSSDKKSIDQPGRNDPCPCGSGRKYKHCCSLRNK
jgi:predicted aspartyl protease